MLILTRTPVESILIGEPPNQVKVTVLGVKGNQVRIGIDAPRDIEVHREEVYERLYGRRDAGTRPASDHSNEGWTCTCGTFNYARCCQNCQAMRAETTSVT